MKIGIIIGRIGGVDGVALETEKWIEVLQKMGHEIFLLAGQYEEREIDKEHERSLPVLSFFSLTCKWEQDHAFFNPIDDPASLLEHLEKTSEKIAGKICKWLDDKKIEVFISENASALPSHLSMGIGIKKAIEKTGINTITHDHDFAWERDDRYVSPHKKINQLIEQTFPLQISSQNIHYAVINLNAKKTLKKKFGINAVAVPNVMDFEIPFGQITDENKSLLKDLGLNKNDIPLFQITRIVGRKGIEVAIELVHRLKDENIKLIVTGSHKDDDEGKYYNFLNDLIHDYNLQDQVLFGESKIKHHSWVGYRGSKIYSLSDAYAHARACTYFSTYEGFGNAFVEAVVAKKPIFVNNYKPVFMPDIGSKGFKVVMLENNVLTGKAVDEMKEIIYNEKLCREIGEYNFELGKKHFSYSSLRDKLEKLLKF
ncbi:MAG: glycosyltransferase family 4 protein [Bacteroidetes bacterium]|nr:glycosyltransferase family 4 protein [Bacteroidota bacterium]